MSIDPARLRQLAAAKRALTPMDALERRRRLDALRSQFAGTRNTEAAAALQAEIDTLETETAGFVAETAAVQAQVDALADSYADLVVERDGLRAQLDADVPAAKLEERANLRAIGYLYSAGG